MNKFAEPVFCQATEADIPALIRLFRQCFTEDTDFLSLYFYHCFPLCRTYVLRLEGHPVASASYLPIRYRRASGTGREAFYLYGVCTDPQHRRQGLIHRLLNCAREEIARSGAAFILCRPATPELFHLYAGLGYTEPVYRHFFEISLPENISRPDLYAEKKTGILSDPAKLTDYDNCLEFSRISWSGPMLEYILNFYKMAQGWCLDCEHGSLIAVQEPENESILTVEYQTFSGNSWSGSDLAIILGILKRQTIRALPACIKKIRILVSPDQVSVRRTNDMPDLSSILFAVADPISTVPDPSVFFSFPME